MGKRILFRDVGGFGSMEKNIAEYIGIFYVKWYTTIVCVFGLTDREVWLALYETF